MQVQSHAIPNAAVETGDMRRNNIYFLTTIALFLFVTSSFGYQDFQVTFENSKTSNQIDALSREKRQLEEFENDYPTPSAQEAEEEPGFWDRVVKVAIKLFSRFIEWLNSS
ncbi:jg9465 [Pararge aegeria aegeria]|uniref:Jg9465 protein n=2 Tax=Pararge aegeria TaxID=116150 RepID=A0A8S4RK47_9NEOP|nr:jg9465 [Pararge aegeria aegeria]